MFTLDRSLPGCIERLIGVDATYGRIRVGRLKTRGAVERSPEGDLHTQPITCWLIQESSGHPQPRFVGGFRKMRFE